MEYRALFRSELKQEILLRLLKGNKKLSELKAEIESTETTILHVLKEFEKLDLTTKSAGIYRLSSLGRLEAKMCKECYKVTEVMEKFKDFWLNHDVEPIPPSLALKIGSLQQATLVKTESSELGKVHETYLKMMTNTKKVLGTSPIFHKDYLGAFRELLTQGGTIDLILTGEVLGKTLENAVSSGDGELFQKFMNEGQLKIYLLDDLKIALTVTENLFSMGLFDLEGQYDYSTDLISLDPESLQWGEEVFQAYLKQAKKVEL
jgi:predicted transcriptional regulator